jgi:hydroxymethylpyrimidine/phosphomethylpyrimidine kinase
MDEAAFSDYARAWRERQLNALTEFDVDLVDLDACPAWLAEAIRRDGTLAGRAGATTFLGTWGSYAAPNGGGANKKPVPRALTIAGSDSGGGAGIQADLKTFTALGVYGASVLTAVTAQNTRGVVAVQELSPETVAVQFRAVMDDIGADAVKTGMLGTATVAATVAALLREYRVPRLVVDPVMHAKGGHPLLTEEGQRVLARELLPLALVVTPNLAEAGILLGREVCTLEDMREAARRLRELGPSWVVIKGGHLEGDPVDLAYDGRDWLELRGPRFPVTVHGTGCTFSAALTAGLARGLDVPAALVLAREFTALAIRHAPALGRGHRPPNHAAAGRLMDRSALSPPPGDPAGPG